jgi:NAD(P)-dependent dehydrogenase (short-subunit alcohol dehydrogenase family)
VNSLTDQVVLITGASSGIGRCLALQLAAQGARLALCGRSEEKLHRVVSELESASRPPALARAFCVSSEEAILQFVADTQVQLGPIDILINCAGANTSRAAVAELETADLDWMMTVNFRAAFIFLREALCQMQPRGKGHIVNIVSTVALFGNPGLGGYTASKWALEGLTKVFRKEAKASGIKVTSVHPGGTDTDFRPTGRPDYMSPESVAQAIVSILTLPDDAVVHDLVLRPPVEDNFV